MSAIHPRISVNSLCFAGAEIPEILESWRNLSPTIVSLRSNLLTDKLSPRLIENIRENHFRVETISHAFISDAAVTQRELWPAARADLNRLIRSAEAIGARSVYMLTGGHGNEAWEDAAQAFSEAISPCVSQAREAGILLLIEPAPIFYADSHLAHSLRDTVLLAEMADLGVCIDVFPVWAEAGLKETIQRAMPRCHLVQLSDYVPGDRAMPCRAVPGTGAIPLERLMGWLNAAGYQGNFDLELIGPRIDAFGHVDAVRATAQVVGAMIDAQDVSAPSRFCDRLEQ
ncbi:sugar phosphate isomerase/epimerase [Novosphingobium sp. G106]|uniref:sugar phosphate isomerase/epimerase family protein n=1 Tax=Novosphingobium sp. G106 TaxID=2849500 RepID=UPI001C2D8C9B|nr:TIM barrel protein [Novosphingobium sp. G106]MBV1686462.1 sugar phosphate isomerase/epimerase [Novosphingobium sp. G106]